MKKLNSVLADFFRKAAVVEIIDVIKFILGYSIISGLPVIVILMVLGIHIYLWLWPLIMISCGSLYYMFIDVADWLGLKGVFRH